MPNDLYDLIGPVDGASIIEDVSFENLNGNSVFIKRQLALILSNGTRVLLANPDYLEFFNSTTGREKLLSSNLDKRHTDAVLLLWGNEPTVPENPE